MTLPHFVQFMQHRGGKSAGAIRVSLGIVSNRATSTASAALPPISAIRRGLALGEVTFDIESCRVIRDGS